MCCNYDFLSSLGRHATVFVTFCNLSSKNFNGLARAPQYNRGLCSRSGRRASTRDATATDAPSEKQQENRSPFLVFRKQSAPQVFVLFEMSDFRFIWKCFFRCRLRYLTAPSLSLSDFFLFPGQIKLIGQLLPWQIVAERFSEVAWCYKLLVLFC